MILETQTNLKPKTDTHSLWLMCDHVDHCRAARLLSSFPEATKPEVPRQVDHWLWPLNVQINEMPQLPTRNICNCIKWGRVASCGLCGGHTIFCCVVVTKAENNILNIISTTRGVSGRYVGGSRPGTCRSGRARLTCRTAWELTMLVQSH